MLEVHLDHLFPLKPVRNNTSMICRECWKGLKLAKRSTTHAGSLKGVSVGPAHGSSGASVYLTHIEPPERGWIEPALVP